MLLPCPLCGTHLRGFHVIIQDTRGNECSVDDPAKAFSATIRCPCGYRFRYEIPQNKHARAIKGWDRSFEEAANRRDLSTAFWTVRQHDKAIHSKLQEVQGMIIETWLKEEKEKEMEGSQ